MLTQPLGNRDLGASVFPIVFGELAFPLAPGWLLWAKIAMGPLLQRCYHGILVTLRIT